MDNLNENTLLRALLELRRTISEPVCIKPTQLIIGDREITGYMKKWKLSRAKTIARIKRLAAL